MKFSAFILSVTILLGVPVCSQASAESQRDLRNALHFYNVGQYEKAKGYFIVVLSLGTAKEQRIARVYLAKPELRHPPRSKTYSSNPSALQPSPRTEPLLEEPVEPAPERRERLDDEAESRLHLSGNLRNETAFRLSPPDQLSKLRTLGYLAGTGQWSEEFSYKVSGRLWYDAVYDMTDHYPRPVEDDQKKDGELRDTYVDFSHQDWDVRLGKQQIVWGEAVGLFYADVVNAKDLREFVLPDFEFIRIPEWSSDVEYTHESFHAELIWLPFPEMDKVGRPGSEYAFVQPAPPGAQVVYGPESDPAQSLGNSEVGGRLSYQVAGWDFGAFHLRTWDKFPVYTVSEQPGEVALTATHPRLTLDGATFSKEVNEVVLKGEFIYNWQKYFQSTDPSNPTGIVPKDFMDCLLGADYVFPGKLDTALQLGQRIIRNYQPDLFQQREVRTLVTLWLKRPFWDDQLEPEVILVKDLNSTDAMVRPKISYKLTSHWRITLGVDLFGGAPDGLFGEFADRNRGYTELRYDF